MVRQSLSHCSCPVMSTLVSSFAPSPCFLRWSGGRCGSLSFLGSLPSYSLGVSGGTLPVAPFQPAAPSHSTTSSEPLCGFLPPAGQARFLRPGSRPACPILRCPVSTPARLPAFSVLAASAPRTPLPFARLPFSCPPSSRPTSDRKPSRITRTPGVVLPLCEQRCGGFGDKTPLLESEVARLGVRIEWALGLDLRT